MKNTKQPLNNLIHTFEPNGIYYYYWETPEYAKIVGIEAATAKRHKEMIKEYRNDEYELGIL